MNPVEKLHTKVCLLRECRYQLSYRLRLAAITYSCKSVGLVVGGFWPLQCTILWW